MKKQSKFIISSTLLIILLSIILMVYFGFNIIKPIIDFVNRDAQITDHISVIKQFFE